MHASTSKVSPSKLTLENGFAFEGISPNWQTNPVVGEVVFTTGMTGYPESLTDPSYAGQILLFTYPLIGNYGVPPKDRWESEKIHAVAVVVGEACVNWSHYTGLSSLTEWLEQQQIPILTGVDTRAITKILRGSGTLNGAITYEDQPIPSLCNSNTHHWVSHVSLTSKRQYGKGKKKIIAVDCGMKENIIRSLSAFPVMIERVPHDYDYSNEDFDALFVSNGPGDPIQCVETIKILKKAMKQNKPIFGICLGAQLMALAAGARTYKLPFGHRGQNQPCLDVESRRCYLTSQNHGYAIDASSLSKEWGVTFTNLNDQSVEGIAHRRKPFFSVQFHPEATPGPTDTQWLFEKFYQLL